MGFRVPADRPVPLKRSPAQPLVIAITAPERPATARSVARVTACALWGLETALLTVEVDVANGLPALVVVGLPDAAVQEARERVRAAVRNSGFEFPLRRVTPCSVNARGVERRRPPRPTLEVTDRDFKAATSAALRPKAKSPEKRLALRATAWLRAFVVTP
jgi:hypothetical protein